MVPYCLQAHELQHIRLPCPSATPGPCSNSCPSSQWCHPAISSLSSPFNLHPPAFNLSQHQGLFQWVSTLHQVIKILELQLQHQPFQWVSRIDFIQDWLVWSPCSPRDSQESSPAPQFKSISFSSLSLLYGPTLTSVGLPGRSAGKESVCDAGDPSLIPVSGRPWRRDRLPTPVFLGFPCGSAGKESARSVGDLGLIPGLGRSPGGGKGYPLQYSGLENSMDCRVHGVTKNRTRLSDFHF